MRDWLLTRSRDQVRTADAVVRAVLAEVLERLLPEVEDDAGRRTGGILDDHRPRARQVGQADDVRHRHVGAQDATMILEALVDDDVDVAHAERAPRLVLPLRHADERKAPQVCLRRTLHRRHLEQSSRFILRDGQQRLNPGSGHDRIPFGERPARRSRS